MKGLALVALLIATPVFAADAPSISSSEEQQLRTNSMIVALQRQRDEAMNQVVMLSVEIDGLKRNLVKAEAELKAATTPKDEKK